MAMRVLIPIGGFARTGGFRVLSELANHWIELGAEVDFLVDERSAPPYFPTRARLRWFDRLGGEVAANERSGRFVGSGNAWSIHVGMWRALKRISAEYGIVLANHSLTALPVALGAAPQCKRFYYVQAYEPEYYGTERGPRARVLQALSWLSYKLPLIQIANAPLYLGYRSIRARDWVPPGLDMSLFRRREAIAEHGIWKLGTIGRREAAKGTPDVLAAFEILAQRRDDVQLEVAYGNLPQGWTHPRARIVVPQSDAELAHWYRSIDILLAPGTAQLGACHYPVLEAMTSGVPVVTTGYLPAGPDNAWIVPVGAPAAIAAAVEDIMQAPRDRLVAKLDLAAEAVRPFEWHAVAARFLRILERRAGLPPAASAPST